MSTYVYWLEQAMLTRLLRMEATPFGFGLLDYRILYSYLKLSLDLQKLGDHQILMDYQTPYCHLK